MPDFCRCVVLVSGSGTNLQALLDARRAGRLGAEVAGVVSSRPEARALERARQAGVPTRVVDPSAFPDRAAYDAALGESLARLEPDLVVLAGFMQILTPELVGRFAGRMINLHPSLLPAFRGLDTHRKALAAGCRIHGTSVHFVTEELDSGPIIAQAALAVADDDTPDSLGQRVQALEHRLLPEVVRWFAEQRLELRGSRVRVFGAPTDAPPLIVPALEDDQRRA